MMEPDTIKSLRERTGLTQKAFGDLLHIPHRSIQNWEGTTTSSRSCPPYLVELIAFFLKKKGLLKND